MSEFEVPNVKKYKWNKLHSNLGEKVSSLDRLNAYKLRPF